METLHRYDGTLQMFVDQPRDADARHLRFLRWLGERGALEHEVAGPPCGSYAATAGGPEPGADRWSGHDDPA